MKHYTIAIALILVGLCACQKTSTTTNTASLNKKSTLSEEEIQKLDSLNIDFQFRGNCYAYSSAKNAKASNGEAHSDNLPKTVDESFPKNGFYMLLNEKEFSKIDSHILGCKLYLVNTTDTAITLRASDSRLYIVAEALREDGTWVPISYLPSSGCGNSHHTVVLDKNEYWSFDVPIFKGAIKTKLRYTLTLDSDEKISSNEIVAFINKEQLDESKKQGHHRTNLMDPYTE